MLAFSRAVGSIRCAAMFCATASPNPEEPNFVNIGSEVKVGDVICIIEAMKTFNQVEAEVAGKVIAIHKQNGDPVEK